MDGINKTYLEHGPEAASKGIDDQTTADLFLDDVVGVLGPPLTTPGQGLLYHWLRTPCGDSADLTQRLALAKVFESAPGLAAEVGKVLSRLGVQDRGDVGHLLWVDRGDQFWKHHHGFRSLLVSEGILVLGSLVLGAWPLLVFLLVSLVNWGLYLATTRHIGRYAASLQYMGRMFFSLRALAKVLAKDGLPPGFPEQDAEAIRALSLVARKVPWSPSLAQTKATVGGDLLGMALDYVRIFLLGELRAYFRFHAVLHAQFDAFERAYQVLGRFDASLVLARFRRSRTDLCDPGLDGASIQATGLVHPLVEGFVPLDFGVSRSLIVTGSNMAGKSTFLRTLGLNQVLATTVGTVFAQTFQTGFLTVVTSIGVQDCLWEGKSRYLAEAERLLFLVEEAGRGPRLILIDEILSGTNSADRLTASVGILKELALRGAKVVASTHDVPIAEALVGVYDPAFFSELVDGDDLAFDYRLHPGVGPRGNALRILEKLGFSRAILCP